MGPSRKKNQDKETQAPTTHGAGPAIVAVKKQLSLQEYAEGILSGNRVILSRAITLLESTRADHRELAEALLEYCLPYSGKALRIGITGSPGVGKSTFIEALGIHVINEQHRLAVLAIDPSSRISKGSILGDKTRMMELSAHPQAYIRPSPAGESLGGVAQQTRETILLCEAAGFDVIFVETVGVGQSETAVRSMVDFFLLLLLPGAGDELQGIKRGIVEMADLLAVNKADGDRVMLAKRSKAEYQNALHLFPVKSSGWNPKALLCSATEKQGIDQIWQEALAYQSFTQHSGYWHFLRSEQNKYWLHERIHRELHRLFYESQAVAGEIPAIEEAVREGRLSSYKAVNQLLELFMKSGK